MKWYKFIDEHAVLLFVLLTLLSSTGWAGQGQVSDDLKETLDQIIAVLNDPSLQAPDKQDERRNILLKLVKKRIDDKAFAKRALGVHWKKRTKEEKQEFVKIFERESFPVSDHKWKIEYRDARRDVHGPLQPKPEASQNKRQIKQHPVNRMMVF